MLLTAGTDGHAVLWPLPSRQSSQALEWQAPTRLHQNASKTMASYVGGNGTTLLVSGGDDGALAFVLAYSRMTDSSSAAQGPHVSPPVLVSRAHGSAVTACVVINIGREVYVLTSGNDEWIRLWEVVLKDNDENGSESILSIKRLSKVKTSVADVSSMALLSATANGAKILLCGVGMEVIRLDLSKIEE